MPEYIGLAFDIVQVLFNVAVVILIVWRWKIEN